MTKVFDYASIEEQITGWDCASEPGETIYVYDQVYYGALISEGAYFSSSVAATAVAMTASNVMDPIQPPLSSSGSTSTLSPTASSTTPLIATGTAAPTPSPKRGLSNGAIAGIVVGIVLFLLIALGMILLYRYFKGRKPPPPSPPQQLIRDTTTQPTSMATAQPGSQELGLHALERSSVFPSHE